jgi:hypothetical protein
MIDLKDRKYVKIIGGYPEHFVCFDMNNGLEYFVWLRTRSIHISYTIDSFVSDKTNLIPASDLPKEDVELAEDILNTGEIHSLANWQIKLYEKKIADKKRQDKLKRIFGQVK